MVYRPVATVFKDIVIKSPNPEERVGPVKPFHRLGNVAQVGEQHPQVHALRAGQIIVSHAFKKPYVLRNLVIRLDIKRVIIRLNVPPYPRQLVGVAGRVGQSPSLGISEKRRGLVLLPQPHLQPRVKILGPDTLRHVRRVRRGHRVELIDVALYRAVVRAVDEFPFHRLGKRVERLAHTRPAEREYAVCAATAPTGGHQHHDKENQSYHIFHFQEDLRSCHFATNLAQFRRVDQQKPSCRPFVDACFYHCGPFLRYLCAIMLTLILCTDNYSSRP